jgi:hypothetical protein
LYVIRAVNDRKHCPTTPLFTPAYCLNRTDIDCFLAIAGVAFFRAYDPRFFIAAQFKHLGTDFGARTAPYAGFIVDHRDFHDSFLLSLLSPIYHRFRRKNAKQQEST